MPSGKTKNRVGEVVDLVGLTKEQNKQIGALSKGFRQRVGLAQSLIHDPDVLILDEPTTGLDPNQILEIRQVIKQVSQDKTVVFSTHIMQEVQALCDRVVIIRDGEIVADSPTEALGQKGEQVSIRLELEQIPTDLAELKAIEGLSEVQMLEEANQLRVFAQSDIRKELFQFAKQKDLVLLEMVKEKTSLEGIFKDLTTK